MAVRLRRTRRRSARRRAARDADRQPDLGRQAQERHRLPPVLRQGREYRVSQRQHHDHRYGTSRRRSPLPEVRRLFPGPHDLRLRLSQHRIGRRVDGRAAGRGLCPRHPRCPQILLACQAIAKDAMTSRRPRLMGAAPTDFLCRRNCVRPDQNAGSLTSNPASVSRQPDPR